MDSTEFYTWAEGFFQEREELLVRVLPFTPKSVVEVNEDELTASGVLEVELAYSGPALPVDSESTCPGSDLYSATITYQAGPDRSATFPVTENSSFQIRAAKSPAVRFEYERNKTSVPAAHFHVHGVGGLLSPGLMRDGKKGVRNGDRQSLHLRVGGHRFRPSMEDFLYFTINECGFRAKENWEATLLSTRREWLDTQCRAAVRDSPRSDCRRSETTRLHDHTARDTAGSHPKT